MTLPSPTTVPFHRRNGPTREVPAYISPDPGAILVYLPDGEAAGGYFFVSYCQAHEVAWDPRDFGGNCPICQAEEQA